MTCVGVMIKVITTIRLFEEAEIGCCEVLEFVVKTTNNMINTKDNRMVMRVSDCRVESLKAYRSGFRFSLDAGVVSGVINGVFFR